MTGSLRIARIAGIDIKVHFTFLLVVLLGAWQWGSTGPAGALFGALLTVLIFVCVALHELGHSLVALAFGIPVRDITLLPIGGVAQLGRKPDTPGQELLIALAGPAVNVLIAGALFAFTMLAYGSDELTAASQHIGRTTPTLTTLWLVLLLSNVALAVFNLIPAFPMDGGRVFRALLSFVTDAERATRIAAVVGQVIAVALFFTGVFLVKSPMLPFIAVFIFLGAGAEVREARTGTTLKAIRSGDAVNPYAPRFTPATTLAEAVQALVFTPHPAFAVEHSGQLLGVVTREGLVQAARDLGPATYLAGVMERSVPVVQASESLDVARTRMLEARKPFVAVVDHGLFLGVVTEMELVQQLTLAQQLRRQMKQPSRSPTGAGVRKPPSAS